MRRSLAVFTLLAAIFNSCRGMGTIDKGPMRISAPYRPFLGLTVIGTRSSGPAPIPMRQSNQRQRRKLQKQMA